MTMRPPRATRTAEPSDIPFSMSVSIFRSNTSFDSSVPTSDGGLRNVMTVPLKRIYKRYIARISERLPPGTVADHDRCCVTVTFDSGLAMRQEYCRAMRRYWRRCRGRTAHRDLARHSRYAAWRAHSPGCAWDDPPRAVPGRTHRSPRRLFSLP